MPLTTAFLDVCRGVIDDLAELSSYRSEGALADATRSEKVARWARLFEVDSTGTSEAQRLQNAIRGVVNAEADKYGTAGSGVVNASERESGYRTLVSEYMPAIPKPLTSAQAAAVWEQAVSQGIQ